MVFQLDFTNKKTGDSMNVPSRSEILQDELCNSERWFHYSPRRNDIVLSAYPKSGSTWVEHILLYLIQGVETKLLVDEFSSWVEYRYIRNRPGAPYPIDMFKKDINDRTFQRVFKTHLPPSHVPYYGNVLYLIVGRDARDVFMSYFNHWYIRGWIPDTNDLSTYWQLWIKNTLPQDKFVIPSREGRHPFFDFYQHWWEHRKLNNVLLITHDELKTFPKRTIIKIAKFIQIKMDRLDFDAVAHRTSFEYMQANADTLLPNMNYFKGGAKSFIYKGTNGRWKKHLTGADMELYEEIIIKNMSASCRRWLENTSGNL